MTINKKTDCENSVNDSIHIVFLNDIKFCSVFHLLKSDSMHLKPIVEANAKL